MAKQRFTFNNNYIETGSSAKDELTKIQTQEYFNIQIIPYDDIEPNEMNDFEIVDIESLVHEIKEYGLIQPLGVIPNKDYEVTNRKKYRLYNGERRYRAIGIILKEDPSYPAFKKGIPCVIDKKDISPIDEEIKLILANKQRNMSEEFKRKKAQRLIELYQQKAAETGEKTNITKVVAKDMNIGERQVRRYSSISKLIPELQKAFDESKFNLERAASIANMDEESQRAILQLIENNKKIGTEEVLRVKKEKEILQNELNKMEELVQNQTKETEKLEKDLNAKNLEIQKITKNESDLRAEILNEVISNAPSQEKIDELEKKIAKVKAEKERIEQESKNTKYALKEKEQSIKELKSQIELSSKGEISENLKERINAEATISAMEKEIEKKLQEYSITISAYNTQYNEHKDNTDFIKKLNHVSLTLRK